MRRVGGKSAEVKYCRRTSFPRVLVYCFLFVVVVVVISCCRLVDTVAFVWKRPCCYAGTTGTLLRGHKVPLIILRLVDATVPWDRRQPTLMFPRYELSFFFFQNVLFYCFALTCSLKLERWMLAVNWIQLLTYTTSSRSANISSRNRLQAVSRWEFPVKWHVFQRFVFHPRTAFAFQKKKGPFSFMPTVSIDGRRFRSGRYFNTENKTTRRHKFIIRHTNVECCSLVLVACVCMIALRKANTLEGTAQWKKLQHQITMHRLLLFLFL